MKQSPIILGSLMAFCVAFPVAITASSAVADPKPLPPVSAPVLLAFPETTLTVGYSVVARFHTGAAGLTAKQRCAKVWERWLAALKGPCYREDVKVKPHGGEFVIAIRGLPLMTVTTEDARANNSSTASLAYCWSHNLCAGLPAKAK